MTTTPTAAATLAAEQFDMPAASAPNGQRRRQSARVAGSDIVPPPEYPARAKKDYDIGSTFNIDLGPEKDQNGNIMKDPKGKPIKRVRTTVGYAERTAWVPEIDPKYEFPEDDTKMLLLALEERDRTLIHGHTGTGKTTLVEQIAARLNYQVICVNFDDQITRADLVGEWIVKGNEMVFMWGIIPLAMRMPGTILLLDEWDAMQAGCSFVLQRLIDKNSGKLLVTETGGTLIPLHEDNTICATANTRGLGDETGMYQGTKMQNFAQLNRFGTTIHLTYLPPAREVALLQAHYPDLHKAEIESLVQSVNQVRKAYENNEVSTPLSPRDLLNWGKKYADTGDAPRSAKYAFLNRMPVQDAAIVLQIVQRAFA